MRSWMAALAVVTISLGVCGCGGNGGAQPGGPGSPAAPTPSAAPVVTILGARQNWTISALEK